jgi:hypothetical protein
MYLFYKHIKDKKIHIFIISFSIFIVLNIIENYVHYNIGRHNDSKNIELSMPSKNDWINIIIVMIIFAFLQGGFTYLFD